MDVSEIITELNDHGFTDTGTTRKVGMIQHTIWEIESREPWPFLETLLTLTFSGSSGTPTNWPSNFRSLLWLKDTVTGRSLTHLRFEDLERTVGTSADYTTVADPLYYYFEGNALKVWPVPPASTTLRLHYLKHSPEISDSTLEAAILIPPQHHRLIVWGALWKLYDMEDDPELAARYQQHFEAGLAQLRASIWQRQLAQTDTIQILDAYDEFC